MENVDVVERQIALDARAWAVVCHVDAVVVDRRREDVRFVNQMS
jgi:hypothetical protein